MIDKINRLFSKICNDKKCIEQEECIKGIELLKIARQIRTELLIY